MAQDGLTENSSMLFNRWDTSLFRSVCTGIRFVRALSHVICLKTTGRASTNVFIPFFFTLNASHFVRLPAVRSSALLYAMTVATDHKISYTDAYVTVPFSAHLPDCCCSLSFRRHARHRINCSTNISQPPEEKRYLSIGCRRCNEASLRQISMCSCVPTRNCRPSCTLSSSSCIATVPHVPSAFYLPAMVSYFYVLIAFWCVVDVLCCSFAVFVVRARVLTGLVSRSAPWANPLPHFQRLLNYSYIHSSFSTDWPGCYKNLQVSAFICWLTGRNYMHRTSCLFFFMRSHALTIAKKAVSRARQRGCLFGFVAQRSVSNDQLQRAVEPLRPITARIWTASTNHSAQWNRFSETSPESSRVVKRMFAAIWVWVGLRNWKQQ